jgi:hypothetical protein
VIGDGVSGFCRKILWYATSEDVDRNALKKGRRGDEHFRIEIKGGEDRK